MLARFALAVSLLLFFSTTAASTGPTVGLAFRHYYSNGAGVRLRCGLPTGSVVWVGNNARERFQRCSIRAHFTITTPGPTRTPTPKPVDTRIPSTPIPTPWPTPQPTATSVIPPGCSDANLDACLLNLIDSERAIHGYAPLALDSTESACSLSHSVHMASLGYISHDQFPQDICVPYRGAAENVGMASGYAPAAAVQVIQSEMIAEPWTPGCNSNHHCNEDGPYTRVGIGVYVSGGSVYLTEDFVS